MTSKQSKQIQEESKVVHSRKNWKIQAYFKKKIAKNRKLSFNLFSAQVEVNWCRFDPEKKVYVYLGETEEFYDNHAAIRNSFDPSEISTFSFLSSKSYDCGPIQTLGDVAEFFNVEMADYPDTPAYETSNGVNLAFKSQDPNEKAYPCGFRAMTIRSSKNLQNQFQTRG